MIVDCSSSLGYILCMYISCKKQRFNPNFKDVQSTVQHLLHEGYSRKQLLSYIMSEHYSLSSAYRILSEECYHAKDANTLSTYLDILSKSD